MESVAPESPLILGPQECRLHAQHDCATQIQAAYRGYRARRYYGALVFYYRIYKANQSPPFSPGPDQTGEDPDSDRYSTDTDDRPTIWL